MVVVVPILECREGGWENVTQMKLEVGGAKPSSIAVVYTVERRAHSVSEDGRMPSRHVTVVEGRDPFGSSDWEDPCPRRAGRYIVR